MPASDAGGCFRTSRQVAQFHGLRCGRHRHDARCLGCVSTRDLIAPRHVQAFCDVNVDPCFYPSGSARTSSSMSPRFSACSTLRRMAEHLPIPGEGVPDFFPLAIHLGPVTPTEPGIVGFPFDHELAGERAIVRPPSSSLPQGAPRPRGSLELGLELRAEGEQLRALGYGLSSG